MKQLFMKALWKIERNGDVRFRTVSVLFSRGVRCACNTFQVKNAKRAKHANISRKDAKAQRKKDRERTLIRLRRMMIEVCTIVIKKIITTHNQL